MGEEVRSTERANGSLTELVSGANATSTCNILAHYWEFYCHNVPNIHMPTGITPLCSYSCTLGDHGHGNQPTMGVEHR